MIRELALTILSLVSQPNGVLPAHFGRAPLGPMHRAESLATTHVVAARSAGVSVALLVALNKWESDFDENAVSHAGAFGISQLLPAYHMDVRGYCAVHPELCSVAVITRGAEVLAHYKRRCATNARAVYAYRNGTPGGKCGGPDKNTLKVLRTASWIRRRLAASKWLNLISCALLERTRSLSSTNQTSVARPARGALSARPGTRSKGAQTATARARSGGRASYVASAVASLRLVRSRAPPP